MGGSVNLSNDLEPDDLLPGSVIVLSSMRGASRALCLGVSFFLMIRNARTLIVPPSGVNFTAFDIKLEITCCNRGWSAITSSGGHSSGAISSVTLLFTHACWNVRITPNTIFRSCTVRISRVNCASSIFCMFNTSSRIRLMAVLCSCMIVSVSKLSRCFVASVVGLIESGDRSLISVSMPTINALKGTRTSWKMYRKNSRRVRVDRFNTSRSTFARSSCSFCRTYSRMSCRHTM
mmetsp:Transcript_66652/g.161242  ORF Transcript_66652/g.161242 Transcript_66652/m.161242 type:complete len:234 (-) Transcript_66652:126-827(-)